VEVFSKKGAPYNVGAFFVYIGKLGNDAFLRRVFKPWRLKGTPLFFISQGVRTMKIESFTETLRRLGPTIKAIAKKVNRKYSYCGDDDFYQEAVLFLWQKHEKGEFFDKTDSYILQGCFFHLKNYLRKVSKTVDMGSVSLSESVMREDERLFEDVLQCDTESAQDKAGMAIMSGDVEDRLNSKEKEIFRMRMEGYTTREIGGAFGVSHVMVVKIANKMRDKCRVLKEELVCG
jgi:RNA polymerase sigma factor (sigma-70 family)